MRLLHFEDTLTDVRVTLVEFLGKDIPQYGILSHTWGADNEEVTFKDVMEGTGQKKPGYDKIRFCIEKSNELQYFWIDTCCIDKSDPMELQEAINSMFRWYQDAAVCYVYLSDVSKEGTDAPKYSWEVSKDLIFNHASWEESKWFKRGWTLQELLAPKFVEFYSADREYLGDRTCQTSKIYKVTKIHGDALRGRALSRFSVNERLKWAEWRQVTREEDTAYSLLGLFDLKMPIAYGEGREQALFRLQKRINESRESRGHLKPAVGSIFKWIRGGPEQAPGKSGESKFHKMDGFQRFIFI
jgi:hypothetical protein